MSGGQDALTGGMWNALWARAFLDELARAGVQEICVAPGSRSTPLVLAAAKDRRFRLFSIVDERSAGFFALGVGKAAGRPAAVITTSGTAAANLYPAVIEASQGESPLLVLTADRPHRLRDTDGNQAMDQLRLFGAFPRAFFEVEPPRLHGPALRHLRALASRAVALSLGPPAGPVHLNFPFEKPLDLGPPEEDPELEGVWGDFRRRQPRAAAGRSGGRSFTQVRSGSLSLAEAEVNRLRNFLEGAGRGVIVAGPCSPSSSVGEAVLRLGGATGFPVLADPLSGARFGPDQGAWRVGGYDLFLRSPGARRALEPDLILRVGGSPTSAAALEYMAEYGQARQIVVNQGGRWKDHLASAHEYLVVSPEPLLDRMAKEVAGQPDSGWRELWADAEGRTRKVLQERNRGELLEGEILAMITEALPPRARLLVASSMPIRDLDAFAFPGSKPLRVYGNRGVSGIDGLVSTTLGLAAGSQGPVRPIAQEEPPAKVGGRSDLGGDAAAGDPEPTVGVLGDLAFYHDMNGLLALRALEAPVVLVVINNDGGGIFQTLPVRNREPAFTEYFSTPHGLDFEKAADLYGIPFGRAESLEDLRGRFSKALAAGTSAILEIRTGREQTHGARRSLMEAVRAAMTGLGSD